MCKASGVPGSYSRATGPAWSPARLRLQAPAAERARRLMPHALACLAARTPSAGARGSPCASASYHPIVQAQPVPVHQAGTRSDSPQHWPASLLQAATLTSYTFHTQLLCESSWLMSTAPLGELPYRVQGLEEFNKEGRFQPRQSSSSTQAPPHRSGQDSKRAEAALLWHGAARWCWQRRGRRRGIQ